jgi:hypothetical protein
MRHARKTLGLFRLPDTVLQEKVMKSRKVAMIAVLPVFLSGCLHFVDSADVNLKPDVYFTSRNYILSGESAFAQDIAGLVGRIAYKDKDGVYQFMNNPVLEGNAKPAVKAVQSAYSYSSKVDKGYSVSASFPFISPDATGKTATDYELRDVADATVDPSAEPNRTQFAAAAKVAGAPEGQPWYWVRSVVLGDLRQQQSVNLNGQATVTGSGFSINGQIYNNPSAAQWVPLVSIDPVPMNAAADMEVKPGPVPPKNLLPNHVLPEVGHTFLVPAKIQ